MSQVDAKCKKIHFKCFHDLKCTSFDKQRTDFYDKLYTDDVIAEMNKCYTPGGPASGWSFHIDCDKDGMTTTTWQSEDCSGKKVAVETGKWGQCYHSNTAGANLTAIVTGEWDDEEGNTHT